MTYDPGHLRAEKREGCLHDHGPEAEELSFRTPDAQVRVCERLCLPVSEPYDPVERGEGRVDMRNLDQTMNETYP